MESANCTAVIPESADEFLRVYPDPYLVPKGALSTLLNHYCSEVEPHFRWHFCGPVYREPEYISGHAVKTGSHADNMPGDWKWRSYLVKERALRKCVDCGSPNNLEADHILRLSIWRSSEIADIDFYDLEAPHSLNNLQCLCHSCHKEKTLDGY